MVMEPFKLVWARYRLADAFLQKHLHQLGAASAAAAVVSVSALTQWPGSF
jgi:hypothetical protein